MNIQTGLAMLALGFVFGGCGPVQAHETDTEVRAAIPDLVLARPCQLPDACTFEWTLATRLGAALEYAEARYGPRDLDWTLLGTEFAEIDQPEVWYPRFGEAPRYLIILLTKHAASDERIALFQLAHEVIHVLSPSGGKRSSSVLEEGLASYNSIDYLQHLGMPVSRRDLGSAGYADAYHLVLEAMEKDPDFARHVRELRKAHGRLSDLSANELRAAFPKLSRQHTERLAAPFIAQR